MTYIDPAGKVLSHLDRVLAWQRGEKPGPVTVEWDLSNRCTLGCQDCHFAHTHVKGPWAVKARSVSPDYANTGDIADTSLVVRSMREVKDAGVEGIVWSGGGEPTTHPHWQYILTAASAYGFQQGMYTLGGLLTHDRAKFLADVASWVVVSLDACDAETYSREKGVPAARFEAACQGVRWLAEAGATVVGVSFLLHEQNWHRALDMATLARALGATYTTFRPVIRTDPAKPSLCTDDRSWIDLALDQEWPTVLQQVALMDDVEITTERFRQYADWNGHPYAQCRGIQLNTTITPDGRVWLCPQRRGIDGSCLGDLRIESFDAIWARHPSQYPVNDGCRVMCRLHPVNLALDAIATPRAHEAFI